MNTKTAYQNELYRYSVLKTNVSKIIKLLNESADKYETMAKTIKESFLIDGADTPAYLETKKQADEIYETSQHLEKVVLSEIGQKMANLRFKILSLEE